jgi:glycosyltransferase involved in cell wall biosynthesis
MKGQFAFMKEAGLEVSALSSGGDDLVALSNDCKIQVYAVDMPRRISPLQDLGAIRAICRVIKQVRPDIVHAHTPKAGLLGMISAKLCGVPIRIFHVHGLLIGHKHDRLLRQTEKMSCRLASKVFCVSHFARKVYVDEGLCPADKIVTFCGGSISGVDAENRFNPDLAGQRGVALRESLGIPADGLVIGFVGRIVRDKGMVELSEAWAALREQFPNLHLLLAGPIEDQDPLPPSVLESFQKDNRVHLTGLIDDTAAAFAAMDLLVLPTYREGLPIAPLEAAAMEKPVVATLIPGCQEAISDGETGTLVPARDAGALKIALEAYISNPELRAAHGRAGRARMVSEFRPEPIWQAMLDEYRKLLAAQSR